MKKCTKCHQLISLEGFYFNRGKNLYESECKECHKKYNKMHIQIPEFKSKIRLQRYQYTLRNREKRNARGLLHYYIKTGKIAHLACEVCGNFLTTPHHWDYSKPLDIWWLCKKHHVLADKGKLVLYEK